MARRYESAYLPVCRRGRPTRQASAAHEAPTYSGLSPTGEAVQASLGAVIIAALAQGCLLVGGSILWLAMGADLPYRYVLLISCAPWALAALQILRLLWALIGRAAHAISPSEHVINYNGLPLPAGDFTELEPERIRIVPYKGASQLIDGVPTEDLRAFVRELPVYGHTQRAWRGRRMPSGTICDAVYWQRLCEPLRKTGILEGVGPRTKGHLTVRDPEKILEILQIAD